jgi:hypothetical protein
MSRQPHDLPPETLDRILEAVRDLQYGSVEIVVHDSRVVQIERREKVRLDERRTPSAGTPSSNPPPEPSPAGKKSNTR